MKTRKVKADVMFFDRDPYLRGYERTIRERYMQTIIRRDEIAGYGGKLADNVNNYLYYGVHREKGCWYFREYAPNARKIYVVGDFNGWQRLPEYSMESVGNGNWELKVAGDKVRHGEYFKWFVEWDGGAGERLPLYATRCVQDERTKLFAAQIWAPEEEYAWKYGHCGAVRNPLIYETHIGMATERYGVGTFNEFTENVLPYIASVGYNTIQIMALQEHPYYGSFGYQVSNFFALSSRFGTPEDFKRLVDKAHELKIAVIMDIVHSHAVKNEQEGIVNIDGSNGSYFFHAGERGDHPAWGTKCFNYGKEETLRFLLSNCKFWMEEYHIDGFRFDGVTSMLYLDHGLGKCFSSYDDYFGGNTDNDALIYLGLANMLVKEINGNGFTIAEDVSGMPGLAAPIAEGGVGFDYRMSMGIADHWIKWIKELRDEQWDVGNIYYELTNKRADERTISYAECHDQALVGDKTIIFRLIDKDMYTDMNLSSKNMRVDRGIALHKMIRLLTLATASDGYLTFMGNEFGHPEWIDFPREGNGWSYHYARRQWSLCKNPLLRYCKLLDFEKKMIRLFARKRLMASPPVSIYNDIEKQIIVMGRGGYLFIFNFSPVNSYVDYSVTVPEGDYSIVLDTDWKEFDGFERNDRKMVHGTVPAEGGKGLLKLYLPQRSAIVLKKSSRIEN